MLELRQHLVVQLLVHLLVHVVFQIDFSAKVVESIFMPCTQVFLTPFVV